MKKYYSLYDSIFYCVNKENGMTIYCSRTDICCFLIGQFTIDFTGLVEVSKEEFMKVINSHFEKIIDIL